jgi:hypothetical protein
MEVSCLVYSPALKMEAICSSETPADFQRTTRRYIPEDETHNLVVCFVEYNFLRCFQFRFSGGNEDVR